MKKLFKNKKLIVILLVVVLLLAIAGGAAAYYFLIRGGERAPGEEPPPELIEAPLLYEVEGDSVMAVPVGDSVGVFEKESNPFSLPEDDVTAEPLSAAKSEEPSADEETSEEGTSEVEEEEVEEPDPVTTYCYVNLPVDLRVRDYCTLLTAEDFGFVPVDENMIETELPDFEKVRYGKVYLARPIVEKTETTETNDEGEEVVTVTETKTGFVFLMRISWGINWCAVTPEVWEGNIRKPPAENSGTIMGTGMTLTQAVDHVKAMSPQKLGLDGDTMENYKVYALDGAAMVNGTYCLRLNIYSDSDHQTNAVAGQYLLSCDGLHMYQLTESGKVRQLY